MTVVTDFRTIFLRGLLGGVGGVVVDVDSDTITAVASGATSVVVVITAVVSIGFRGDVVAILALLETLCPLLPVLL